MHIFPNPVTYYNVCCVHVCVSESVYGYVCLEAILLLLTGLYNTWIVDWTGPWTKAETNMKFRV